MTSDQVIQWRHREAFVVALLDLCPRDVEQLARDYWRAGLEWWRTHPHSPDSLAASCAMSAQETAVVRRWAEEHAIAAPWFVSCLAEALSQSVDENGVRDFGELRFCLTSQDWIPTRPFAIDFAASIQKGFRPDLVTILHKLREPGTTLRVVLAEKSPIEPLEANPLEETQQEFVERAIAHYRTCAAVCQEAGQPIFRSVKELRRDARWLVRHRVRRESYRRIVETETEHVTAAAVARAVRRLSAVLEFAAPGQVHMVDLSAPDKSDP